MSKYHTVKTVIGAPLDVPCAAMFCMRSGAMILRSIDRMVLSRQWSWWKFSTQVGDGDDDPSSGEATASIYNVPTCT